MASSLNVETIVKMSALQQKEGFFMNHHMPFIRSPRDDLPLTTILDTSHGKSKRTSPQRRRPSSQANKGRVLLPNLPLSARKGGADDQLTILAMSEHKTHNVWVRKIRVLSEQLHTSLNFEEVVRLEGQIRENRQRLKVMNQDNMKENAKLLALQVKLINKTKVKVKQS